MELYPNLRLLRMHNNYKQEYVADALGISQPEYSKLESGHRKLDAVIVRELCKLYDVASEVILQQSSMKSPKPGNAYVRDHPAMLQPRPDLSHVPREVLDQMMYNYTHLLESYIHQQGVQEELIRQFIRDSASGDKNSQAEIPAEKA